jgi:hypothetical protein
MKLYNDKSNAQFFKFIYLFISALHISSFLSAQLQRRVYNVGSGSSLLGMVSASGSWHQPHPQRGNRTNLLAYSIIRTTFFHNRMGINNSSDISRYTKPVTVRYERGKARIIFVRIRHKSQPQKYPP